MAKKSNKQSNLQAQTSTFEKGFTSDINDFHLPENAWTYARNAINNTRRGDLGKLSNEQANYNCAIAPYTIIGTIHLEKDRWILFSTNDFNCEIGEFIEGTCTYTRLVNSSCLGFKKTNLIIGASRPTYNCSFNVYWDDGLNPTRVLDINNIPYIQECEDNDGCITCVDKLDNQGKKILDCDKLRLESYFKTPCIKLKTGPSSGSIFNGSYYAHIAYLINGQRVTDYCSMSNIISLFSHSDINNSIDIEIENLDTDVFDYYELVIVSTVAEKTTARSIGQYSTSQSKIALDFIDLTLPVIPLENFPIITPVPDKSDAVYSINKYLTRVGPTEKFDFNYQPLANQINTYWQIVEYPTNYYANGGTNVGYMRDEVYSFFIRWIYNTGDKSNSYHIPGRAAQLYNLPSDAGSVTLLENADCPSTINKFETDYTPKVFEVYNTAYALNDLSSSNLYTEDNGHIIYEGKMGYWESVEIYDDKNPEIWNSSSQSWSGTTASEYDLCGKPIRHHKFPENTIQNGNTITNHYSDGGDKIRVLGLRFDNIKPPVDNNGKPIKNIVGYEILRGSRNGNKTVLFKGLLNNMFEYTLPKIINGNNKPGLYANYPFNDLNPDYFISKKQDSNGNPIPTHWETAGGLKDFQANDRYSKQNFTFHSPDTMFAKPFLTNDELKIYGEAYGDTTGQYSVVANHPKFKFVTDVSFLASIIYGVGYAIAKMSGTRDIVYRGGQGVSTSLPWLVVGLSSGGTIPLTTLAGPAAVTASQNIGNLTEGFSGLVDGLTGQNFGLLSANYVAKQGVNVAQNAAAVIPGSNMMSGTQDIYYKDVDRAPTILRALSVIPTFTNYIADGSDSLMNLIRAASGYRDHVLQYTALCKYENFKAADPTNRRRKIDTTQYLKNGLFDFKNQYVVNHLNRQETVLLNTDIDVENTVISDTSRLGPISSLPDGQGFSQYVKRASSHYAAYKVRLRNQYNNLQSIRQLPTQSCYTDIANTSTNTIFGGDIYIGKYSEKNTMYYFQQWLNGEPNGYEFNYFKYQMLEYITYWMDSEPFDTNEFMSSITSSFGAISPGSSLGDSIKAYFENIVTPSDKFCFDRGSSTGTFILKNAYMYLFNSGVRDFFVETELNIDCRDYGDEEAKKHYPIITDLKTIFNNNIIKADNYYKLDRSLNVSFLPYSKISWGSMQSRIYNPSLYQSCYTYRPNRLIYSLPQQTAALKDNWSIFLPNNYKDFTSKISNIKLIDRTAALFLFENESPGLLPGIDTLTTGNGINISIGDGNLFARDLQRLSNSESSYEYGASQNRLSAVNTPFGLFYINLNQGKLFLYGGGLQEISLKNNEQWLNIYLPYKITEDFPAYDLLDNPVIGVGCQTIFDNEFAMVYFCKKDYKLKPQFIGSVEYIGNNKFRVNNTFNIEIGDPYYFENASWTLSYDPHIKEFISFHDWHPDLAMSGKNTFLTIKKNGLWRHNKSFTKYCNYYGVDYPFEVEFQLDTKFNVTTVKNIEYYLENFIYADNGYDRFLVLDRNFDEAVLHNTEQCSGLLKLHLQPTNDLKSLNEFPKVNINYIDIHYSKEEQQYRFNQFWDITKDRGEFTHAVNFIWNTESNGYIRHLNPDNLNYNKPDFQKKKFRHHTGRIALKRVHNDNVEMLINMALGNLEISHR